MSVLAVNNKNKSALHGQKDNPLKANWIGHKAKNGQESRRAPWLLESQKWAECEEAKGISTVAMVTPAKQQHGQY